MVFGIEAYEPAIDQEGFEVPSWEADVPIDAVLRACPRQLSTRGVFFQCICEQVREQRGLEPDGLFDGLSRRQWVVFQSYPLRDFIQLAHNAARLLVGVRSTGEGLRRLGWAAYPSFARTMAGRVVLYALGEELDDVLQVAPKAYEVALPGAFVTSRRLAARHWRLEMRDVYNFVERYQYGVLEGAIREHGYEPQIRLRQHARSCDVDFDVRWSERARGSWTEQLR